MSNQQYLKSQYYMMNTTTMGLHNYDNNGRFVNMQRSQRVKFILFTKILFRLLDKCGETRMLAQAKFLVSAAIRQNKLNRQIMKHQQQQQQSLAASIAASMSPHSPPCCSSLFESVEFTLRDLVGEIYWRRAHGYMRIYISRNGNILLPQENTHLKIGSRAA